MTHPPSRTDRIPASITFLRITVLVVLLVAVGGVGYVLYQRPAGAAVAGPDRKEDRLRAPELDGGVEWLNTAGPIRLKDLRGKVVLLDFWTYCCINCLHVMPDLAKLEKKYATQRVVIGVHSAKFTGEKDSKNIRAAILRYNIEHPVVNDANHKIWDEYAVRSWPTFWLIDPEGYLVARGSGEGLQDAIEKALDKIIAEHRGKKTLNEEPLRFDLAKFRERKEGPLYFPGKVLADGPGKRLFIADSAHQRIVVTDLDGKQLDVIGRGEDGHADGPFDKALFNDPQGMALKGDILYIADRKNHVLRAADLKKRTVTTIAGTPGEQGMDRRSSGPGILAQLNSPWDLWLIDDALYVAMAGHHQIWKMDLKTNIIGPFAGNGREDILDGNLTRSMFAQPSGLTSDGKWLYVADSEVSGVRAVSLGADGTVKTLVGTHLFDFGDEDGVGEAAKLQHCLAVALHDGKVYVADTYNNKLKVIDPATRRCDTFLGDRKGGNSDDPPRFAEPSGLSLLGDQLYVADTNNHAIRVVDLKTKQVRTLKLEGVQVPTPPKVATRPRFLNPTIAKLAEQAIPKDGDLTLRVKLSLPPEFKLNPLAPMLYLVEASPNGGTPFEQQGNIEKPQTEFDIKLLAGKLAGARMIKVSLLYYPCKEGGEGVCQVRSQIWEVPLRLDPAATERSIQLATAGVSKDEGRKTPE